jgi:hypothetical protein
MLVVERFPRVRGRCDPVGRSTSPARDTPAKHPRQRRQTIPCRDCCSRKRLARVHRSGNWPLDPLSCHEAKPWKGTVPRPNGTRARQPCQARKMCAPSCPRAPKHSSCLSALGSLHMCSPRMNPSRGNATISPSDRLFIPVPLARISVGANIDVSPMFYNRARHGRTRT